EAAIPFGQNEQEHTVRGQSNLFEGTTAKIHAKPTLRYADQWSESEKLSREKSVLGFYVSGHPLLKYTDEIEAFASAKLGSPESVRPNTTVKVCGIVSEVKRKIDKRGNTMAFVTIEDFTGKADCVVFSDPFLKYSQLLQIGSIVMVVGKNDGSEEGIKVIVNEVIDIDKVREKFARSVLLNVNLDVVSEATIVELAKLLEQNRGKCQCYLNVTGGDLSKSFIYLTRKYVVEPNQQFVAAAKRLLGPAAVRLQG
ncbi:MAG TPA: OB-fold nucleic acid binding domain-containing protein, partial [Bacteroidota bacterium]|nr:OB-fold nucleic acid binding domain-containing protein [Bacteroidota bacterium]